MRGNKPYEIGPAFGQAVRWADTWQEATDTAQWMADEYLIPYHAWSYISTQPEWHGNHQQVTTCYPQRKAKWKIKCP